MAPTFVQSLGSLVLVLSTLRLANGAGLDKRAVAVSTTLPAGWTSSGCYTDSVANRGLTSAFYADTVAMTEASCITFCQGKGYSIAGVEWSQECYCGNAIGGVSAPAALTDCNMPCTGAATQACGAGNRLNIFALNGAVPPPVTPPPVAPSVVVNPGPGLWSSLGCYTDSVTARTLTTTLGVTGGAAAMTVALCTAACHSNNFVIAGVEYSGECYCGNTFSNGGAPAPDGAALCNMVCNGNQTEYCGGPDRLDVYQYNHAISGTAVATSPPPAVSTAAGAGAATWRLQGCYTDTVAARTLPVGVPVAGGAAAMTPQLCTAACQAAGYVLSGTEYSDECYCGNTLQNGGGPAPDGNALCDMACDGDKTQICGGPNRLTLYYYGTANLQSGASTTSPAKASTTNSAKAQTSTAAAATGWKLLGCYTDTVAARTLPVGVPVAGGAAAMTPQLCTAACQAAGYVLSGTEYSDECYCGNTLQNGGGPAPDGNALCDMTCDGDKTQICGGPNRLTLYSYGAVSLPSGVPTTTTPVASTTTSGAGATGLPAGWKYAACYLDNAFGRILGNEQPDNAALTVQSCVATCAGLGYTIAGLEFSTQCFCDNDIINGGVVATTQSDCNMACSGNANEICGGPNRMSIYAIGPITIFQPPTALTTGLPTNWQYQGCVTDSGASRTLPYQNILTNNNTAQACITLCQTFGYSAAGVEYSDECYCGDQSDFAASGSTTAPSTDCSFTCSGDPHQLCGGPLRMSYYTWEGATPLVTWHTPTGAAAGLYQFLIGGVVIPLITTLGINNKVTFVEKWGTGPPNSTGAYELDLALVNNFAEAWRPMHVKTDVFCSAGLTLPDKAGRQINIGGWSLESTYGIRLYIPDGSPGVPGTNDWQENYEELSLQEGRWYPAAMILANGSMLVVGGEAGSNGTPVPSLEILPRIPGGSTVVTLPFLLRTDPYNLYPFLFVLPSGGVFIAYYNEARILDEVTFATDKVLPNIPAAVNNFLGGRTYPLEGTAVMLPQYPPYTAPVTILICGGSTPYGGNALDNCASTQPEVANPVWTLERMPSRRVMSCITALPDGTYLILNGAEQGEAGFGLGSDPNQNALLYDPTRPVNSRISIMANTTIARLYHSESMLLPDGRVLVSGSDPEDNVHPQEYRVEVFLPPYLLSGLPQPTYTVSSTDWTYNQVVAFTVTSGSTANLRVSLMAAVSSTHGNSLGQRTLFPAWQCAGNTCSFTVPPNNHVAPPGWYQMFILDGPTPSHNTWVRIGGDPAQLGNWPNFPDFTLPGI